MSLLMEALRKAEAAKRAGRSDAASDTASGDASAEATASVSADSGVPEVFKFTTSDDLRALSPQIEAGEERQDLRSRSEPVPVTATTDDVLDDYLSSQQEMDADEVPARPQAERERNKVQEERERLVAASMFNAKAPARPGNKAQQKRMRILAGSLIVVCIGIAGGALYLATQPLSSGIVTNPALSNFNAQQRGFLGEETPTTPPAATAPAATPTIATTDTGTSTSPTTAVTSIAATADTAATPTASAVIEPAGVATTATESVTGDAPPVPATDAAERVQLAVSDPQLESPVESDPQDPVQPPAPTPLDAAAPPPASAAPGNILAISHTTAVSRVQPALQAAYERLMQGDLTGANELYQEVLAQSANNRDALLGYAAVQLQLGNSSGARTTYSRLLQLNPQDALARTGLLQTLAAADPAGYEQELQALHDRFPALAPLNFALGNLHAGNGRWHEAQSAYFDALLQARREGNATPDYAFNLAVSLERIGQAGAALQYYREAETLAATMRPGFDPQLLRERLAELESRP